ncbi:MAG: transcriptional repressor NrdR [Chloroflexi bacterium]|nr:transcriptional repressor NrdR [Chloroflexota bacterium]
MKCPYCGHPESMVVDSRAWNETIRRRRRCLNCHNRFNTFERVEARALMVIKKDERREEFSRAKLETGLRKACEKRPLSIATLDKLVDDIESELYHMGKAEISSILIGEKVLEHLKPLDQIAYIRFASVCQQFDDIYSLKKAVDSLIKSTAVNRRLKHQLPLIADTPNPARKRSQRAVRGGGTQ